MINNYSLCSRLIRNIFCVLITVQVSCSSNSDWENDNFSVTAKLNADGTCSFSVDDMELGVQSKYTWSDFDKIHDLSRKVITGVLCKAREPIPNLDGYPSLYVHIKAPLYNKKHSEIANGVEYKLIGLDEANSMQFSEGIFLSIKGIPKFRKWSLRYCGVDIVSIAGKAVLRSNSRDFGPISLEIVGRGRREFSGC